ncbi:hypothetical protein RB195_017003 [Necator americanus]|uniref:Uncharacterized protein n=1 Tax=Necator americanus TaxID=51031 RepID=A0ABR1C4M3_NECAM
MLPIDVILGPGAPTTFTFGFNLEMDPVRFRRTVNERTASLLDEALSTSKSKSESNVKNYFFKFYFIVLWYFIIFFSELNNHKFSFSVYLHYSSLAF